MTDPVLASLAKRRTELIADAQVADAKLRQLLSDIQHVDGAIRTYDPEYRPQKVRLSRAKHVALSRLALGILRQAPAPMTLRDITLRIMALQDENREDAKLVRYRIEKVRVALLRQRNNGTLRSVEGPRQLVLWEVA